MAKYCSNCGKEVGINDNVCSDCGYNLKNNNNNNNNNSETQVGKSKIAAGLFGIFLGAFGIHNFYLGYNSKALAQLLMTCLSCGILGIVTSIWGLIEGILILAGNIDKDAEGNPLSD